MPSLYRRMIGDAIDQWPTGLREFHDVDTQRCFRGTFRITRRSGWIRSLICWIGGLPPAGENVPVELEIRAEGEKEQWKRRFGSHRLNSVQWLHNGTLMEKLGPVTMAYEISVDDSSFRLVTSKVWLFGFLRIPLFLAPTGDGLENGTEDGVDVVVRAMAPLFGELIRYEGPVSAIE